ncbi:MAG: hypothetical protein ACRD5M_01740 [Candidatus Acidiferrales bacterium]
MISFNFSRARVLGIALGALFMLGGATAARADTWRDCQRKIEHEQRDLDKAIARHGYYSRKAEHERRELDKLHVRCGRRDADRDRDEYHYRD